MILSDQGITKHYYNGAQRVATQISDPFWLPSGTIVEPDGAEYAELAQFLLQATMEMYEPDDEPIEGNNIIIDIEGNESNEVQPNCLDDWRVIDVDYYYLDEDRIRHVLEGGEYAIATPIIYYYHSDHLGGASWITDYNGEPIQYIHYMPYGELWVNQRNSTYDERYKFTGKERDEETGYDFFGARNYSSAITTWLSVDPLADKYPSISSYAYCNWNPIKNIDPDGKAIHVAAGAIIGAVIGGTISGISAMNDPTKSGRQVLGAIAGGAVSGAITGGLTALTGGLSLGATGAIATGAGIGFLGEIAGSAVSQGLGSGEIDGGEVLRAGFVGAAAGTITGAASKGVSEAVKKSGVVQNIQTKMLDGVKSGTGKAAKQQANQTRKSIINFCSPGNDKQFQMKDLITYPADVVGQEVSTGVTTSGAVVDKTQEVQSNVADKLGL